MRKMNLHKKFIDQLSLMKVSTVGGVIEKIGLVHRGSRGDVVGVSKKIEDIVQIFYTVDYLLENSLVEIVSIRNNDQPDFIQDLIIDIFERSDNNEGVVNTNEENNNDESNPSSYIKAMPHFIEKYWGMELLINPSYFKMIQNGYKTDLEKKESKNYKLSIWVPVLVAVLVSFLTALFSYFFNNRDFFLILFIK